MVDCLLTKPEECDEDDCPRHKGGPTERCLLCERQDVVCRADVIDLRREHPNGRLRIGYVCSAHTLRELALHGFCWKPIEQTEESRQLTMDELKQFIAHVTLDALYTT